MRNQLLPSDRIKEGDLYLHAISKKWVPVSASIGRLAGDIPHVVFSRPLKTPPAPSSTQGARFPNDPDLT